MSLSFPFPILVFLATFRLSAQVPSTSLSDQAEIILIILDPTQTELYAAFGHSAFRVSDPANGIDLVFNYGIFDFDQPNFYLNFTKGKLYYKLGTGGYDDYKNYYFDTDRSFREHILQLNQYDKQAIYNYLTWNAKPENADYYYNYCYDNCATRMRDVLKQVLGDRLTFNYSFAQNAFTFRELMDQYLELQPWGDLGIDICLGSQIDRVASGTDYLYMPLYLEKAMLTAELQNDSTFVPLIASSAIVHRSSELPTASIIQPLHFFIALFFVVGLLTHRSIKYRMNYRWVDVLLFGIPGILGVCLLLLWFGTDHLSAYNYNLLWAMPLHLIALVLLLRKKPPLIVKNYFISYGILLILLLVFNAFFIQKLHHALIPFVLTLAIRSFYLVYTQKYARNLF